MLLLSILEKEDSYGYIINKQIEEITNHEFIFSEATLYTSFKRMVEAGFLNTYWLEGDTGRKRKYYSITQLGKSYLNNQREEWLKLKKIINKVIK
ncbi:MAG: PadR family transcriptional regulator [Tenericutes bacterium]|nr:PadR family transcriptional regulator [Mycoplasmatota bacterium]